MAAASSGMGYSFHRRCGRRAKISNHSRTAERVHHVNEFNNAVVICSQSLEDGKIFEVKIDKKITTWSGSILVGATSLPPESFRFPTSISSLSSSSWVFNGESVWKDGKRISNSYGSQSLETLGEGNTVGLLRSAGCLHLYINGVDQGVAEQFLPSHVYPIVDLYGRCAQVSIVQPGGSESASSGSTSSCVTGPLVFHRRCGRLVEVKEGGTAAFRRNAEGEFNHGVVLTGRPLRDGELFEVEITEMVDKWAGSIEMGVTTHRPSEMQFPSTVTNMQSGTWVMSGSGIIRNGDTVQDNFGRSLDSLKVGERVGVMRTREGSLTFHINGHQVGVAATNLPAELYGTVDLYGQCARVKITNGTPPVDSNAPLLFHNLCGENVLMSEDRTTASRVQAYEEFTKSTVFTSRPLRPNELFQVAVAVIVDNWSGSLQMGVTQLAPELLNFDDFEEISDLAEPSWVLSGTEVFHGGVPLESDYPLDLDAVPMGSNVGIMVTSNKELHFFQDGRDMGCAAKDIPPGVYGVVDVYGQCAQVTIVDRRDNSQPIHVTSTPNRTPSIARPSETLSLSSSDYALHPKCGRNITLTDSCTVATRANSYKDGITFSVRPLKEGQIFEVELMKSAKRWQGVLRIGLTTCDPANFTVIPQASTQLPPDSWVVSGSSVLANGCTVAENYGRSLSRLQIGNTVGVQRSPEGAMHVLVNGCDLGPAAAGIPESVYAVVDLYGSTQCVRVVGKQTRAESPMDTQPSHEAKGASSSSESLVVFASAHGPNVQLGLDCRSAKRVRSYSKGIVVSSSPLPNNSLFQVEIKQLDARWSGTVMIGVTGLPPSQACVADKASGLQGQSFVLCASNGTSCLFVGGEKQKQPVCTADLLLLKVGDTVGVLCEANTLSFYVNGQCRTQVPCNIPKIRYAVVDLYGQCCEVELKPLTQISPESGLPLASVNTTSRDNEPTSPSVVRQKLQPWKKRKVPKPDREEKVSNAAALDPTSSLHRGREVLLGVNTHQTVGRSTKLNVSICSCQYQDLCERFVKSLAIPEPYFAVEHNKCYCEGCGCRRGDPRMKYHGTSGAQRKSAVPLGWFQCALRVGPQAEVMNVFTEWHVAYHGTAVGNVRHILDCGGLMLPGDYTFGGHQITRPETHFNEKYKPEGFDVRQIFVSPSIKYCTNGEVYAKSHLYTDPVTGGIYRAKVAFRLRIHPNSYKITSQTVQVSSSQINDQFPNNELEWSTNQRTAIILCGLMVKLEISE